MGLKLAVPKGELQGETATLLAGAGFSIGDYGEDSRCYRPRCDASSDLFVKVFHEKDIAIQVAIGNYDLGICRLDWIQEHLVKYRSEAVVKLKALAFGKRRLYVAAAEGRELRSLESLAKSPQRLRIVSEYPNLAESFALRQRLRNFRIFPVWGAAEAYLPEHAELAIVTEISAERVRDGGMVPLAAILESSACLIANRESLERKDLRPILGALLSVEMGDSGVEETPRESLQPAPAYPGDDGRLVSLAVPDGHQQPHTVELLNRAGVEIEGYNAGTPTRWPRIDVEGVVVRVVRPQDMPMQIANGNFDLAITGQDWVRDHRARFPGSPVQDVMDLGFGKVMIVAVVSNDLPASTTADLRKMSRRSELRIASEYVNIADRYAHNNHLAPCKVIPTWGASEAFLPEDADVLIENTETGSTISRHNLKIIDTLFESSGCVIANSEAVSQPEKRERVAFLVEMLRRGARIG